MGKGERGLCGAATQGELASGAGHLGRGRSHSCPGHWCVHTAVAISLWVSDMLLLLPEDEWKYLGSYGDLHTKLTSPDHDSVRLIPLLSCVVVV